MPIAADRRRIRIDRAGDVAAILDRAAQTPQGCLDPGHAKGFRSHRAATVAGADTTAMERRKVDVRGRTEPIEVVSFQITGDPIESRAS